MEDENKEEAKEEEGPSSEEVDETTIVDEENINAHLKDSKYHIASWVPLVVLAAILVAAIIALVIVRATTGGE